MNDPPRAFKQLDHFLARVEEPGRLFETLTGTLGLPVAWPLASYPAFESGGVVLGNLYLELLRCGPRRRSRAGRFCAVAYEATPIAEAVRELARRAIPHTPVAPYRERGPDGREVVVRSNTVLGRLLGRDFLLDLTIAFSHLPGAARLSDAGSGSALDRWQLDKLLERNIVFLVQFFYENMKDLPHWSEFRNHDEKRAADLARLRAAGGGVVGVESAKEIVAGVKNFEAARALWNKFYAPAAEVTEGVWQTGDDPAVRLVRAERDSIQALVLKVSSLGRAETFLRESGMLGSVANDHIKFDPSKFQGLDVRLVE